MGERAPLLDTQEKTLNCRYTAEYSEFNMTTCVGESLVVLYDEPKGENHSVFREALRKSHNIQWKKWSRNQSRVRVGQEEVSLPVMYMRLSTTRLSTNKMSFVPPEYGEKNVHLVRLNPISVPEYKHGCTNELENVYFNDEECRGMLFFCYDTQQGQCTFYQCQVTKDSTVFLEEILDLNRKHVLQSQNRTEGTEKDYQRNWPSEPSFRSDEKEQQSSAFTITLHSIVRVLNELTGLILLLMFGVQVAILVILAMNSTKT